MDLEEEQRKIKTHEDLVIYQKVFNAAMTIFELSKQFPVEERYSLTDLPPEWQVIVLADRGLYADWLFSDICALNWHPFLRINHQGTFQIRGEKEWQCREKTNSCSENYPSDNLIPARITNHYG